MHPFRRAVEERDEAAIQGCFRAVVFTSPVAFKLCRRPITAHPARCVAGLRDSTIL
jgi:hypothetical protein